MLTAVSLALSLFVSSFQSPDSTKALPRVTPESQGISSAAILSFIEAADSTIDQMNSFMLVRHGKVVAEGWWGPYNPKSPHILYSLTKSFTSAAVGLAVAEGKFSIDDPVLKFFPDEAPAEPGENLKSMRVVDLLRMSTGHELEVPLPWGEPWTKMILAHEVPHRPGTHFLYNTPASYLLSAIVQKTTGFTVLEYLRPRLFEPLGIEHPSWWTSTENIMVGGYGLNLRTEDIARFGQLYLQKGCWQGKQLVPESWVTAASARQISTGSDPDADWSQGYGYQFWRCRHNAYRGDGAFGQYCIVLPDQDAVIAITSGVRDMQPILNLVWDRILPAMRPDSLSPDETTNRQLIDRLSQLSVKPVQGRTSSSLAARVSGKKFVFPENDRGIRSVQLAFRDKSSELVVTTSQGTSRIAIGYDSWRTGQSLFVNGIDVHLPPEEHPIGATGAWTADDTFTVKICLFETPFYTTMHFRFEGDTLRFDSSYNVDLGPPELVPLVGQLDHNTGT